MPRLVDSVLRPLAGELDAGAAADPPGEADGVWAAARTATALRARLGGDCPPGLAEAVAALQDLAGRLAASPARPRRSWTSCGSCRPRCRPNCGSRATGRTW